MYDDKEEVEVEEVEEDVGDDNEGECRRFGADAVLEDNKEEEENEEEIFADEFVWR